MRTSTIWMVVDVRASYLASLAPYRRSIIERQPECSFLSSHLVRHYAKKAKDSGKKDQAASKKSHRGPEKPSVQLTSEELNEVINFEKMRQQMDMALDHLKKDYVEQLSLRTSAAVFDSLTVDTQDGQFSLIEIAQVIKQLLSIIR